MDTRALYLITDFGPFSGGRIVAQSNYEGALGVVGDVFSQKVIDIPINISAKMVMVARNNAILTANGRTELAHIKRDTIRWGDVSEFLGDGNEIGTRPVSPIAHKICGPYFSDETEKTSSRVGIPE